MRSLDPTEMPQWPEGTVTMELSQCTADCGGSPIGRTFTFEVDMHGIVYTYLGVPCVVDGELVHFQLDDSVLASSRPA